MRLRTRMLCNSMILLALAGTAVACGEDVPPLGDGALDIRWEVSPRGCATVGVPNVEISLSGPEARTEIFDCEVGRATIEDLTPGNYLFVIEGIDETGQGTFHDTPQRLTVQPDVITALDPVRLTAKPATIGVEWRFDDGRVCGANGVSEIEVIIFDRLDYEIARDIFDCNLGGGGLRGITAGTYVVEAVGLSADQTYRGLATTKVDRGDEGSVEVILAPNESTRGSYFHILERLRGGTGCAAAQLLMSVSHD